MIKKIRRSHFGKIIAVSEAAKMRINWQLLIGKIPTIRKEVK
jgi:hypothetical protein